MQKKRANRINVYLSTNTLKALQEYVQSRYPGKQATSLVVEEAVKQYLLTHVGR